jgi:hypothetical protein
MAARAAIGLQSRRGFVKENAMICGTMVLEDTAIQWRMLDNSLIEYMVQDSLEGHTATVTCTYKQFAAAMALALGGDEIAGADKLYPLAEGAMPTKEHAPVDWADSAENALRAVRWIP